MKNKNCPSLSIPSTTNTVRSVFFISDRTGLTAETLGNSLLTQFSNVKFKCTTMPFVDNIYTASLTVLRINEEYDKEQIKPIIFCTIVDNDIRAMITQSNGLFLDFFQTFIYPLEDILQIKSSHTVGLAHAISDKAKYSSKMEALNFAINYDDGVNTEGYHLADLILLGVSRSGKTPASIYLAMQFGIKTANYPLVEEDLQNSTLPKILLPYKDKLFGLTIDAHELSEIRTKRYPNSKYATLAQCQKEIKITNEIFAEARIKHLNTTNSSIEELATQILLTAGINRN